MATFTREQVEKWVKELIEQLVNVKVLYGNIE